MSESVEMYLLRIALLQEGERPVPISQLAEELAVSPISANQMCRRLEERKLVEYQPYKGVLLTQAGVELALRVLRKRRLWEVFLVEKLGIGTAEAEEAACRFEHVTPDDLGERLAYFLGDPTHSPQQKPIPPGPHSLSRRHRTLADLGIGQDGQVLRVAAEPMTADFLAASGLAPGARIRLLALTHDGACLVGIDANQVALTQTLAQSLILAPQEGEAL